MRGNVGWWRRDTQGRVRPEGWRPNYIGTDDVLRINNDVAADTPEQLANAKRRRIKTEAFKVNKRRGIRERYDVELRRLRLDKIAATIQEHKWEARPATWIAQRLASVLGVSVTTARLDVKAARSRHGMSSPDRKKI